MIQFLRKSETLRKIRAGFSDEPYLIINTVFAGIIILIFAYSAIFSPDKNDYPVVCIHEKLTGQPCFSCGLSHSFSLIVRGRFDEAYTWNQYGFRVFLFFASQLILRFVFPVIWVKHEETRQQLIIFDSAGSLLIFLIAFWPFMASIFRSVF
jgi:hypothetical protein